MKAFILRLFLFVFVLVYSGNIYAKDTTPPTAKVTDPSAGAYIKGTYTIKADATDNVGVTKVLFYVDQYLFAKYTDTSAPYSYACDTTKLSNGSHTLKVRAYDAAGKNTLSAGVTVTLDNSLPSVAITAPAAGSVSGVVKISASASDNTGVKGVQFLVDGINLGVEDTASPYEINWDTAGKSGPHTLTALARDKAGNAKLSSPVQVTIAIPDQTPPQVQITSPAANSTISEIVTVQANATDNVGVTGVQFKLDDQNVGLEVTASPYQTSLDTASFPDGSHALTAVAKDAAGNSATSVSVSVSIQNATVPPMGGKTVRSIFKFDLIQKEETEQTDAVDEIPFVAEHYDMFIISTGSGQSKVKRVMDLVGNERPFYRYIKIGGLHDGSRNAPKDYHWEETVSANLLWVGNSGQNVRHTQNGWFYTDIIRELQSGRSDWGQILVDLIYRTLIYKNDAGQSEKKSIYEVFDGVFWDNAVADMKEFICDPGYTTSSSCSDAGGTWTWVDDVNAKGCVDSPNTYNSPDYYHAVDETLRKVSNSPELAGWGKMIVNSFLGYMDEGLKGKELLQDDSQGRRGVDGIMFEGLSIKMDGRNPLRLRDRLIEQLKDFQTIVHQNPPKEAYGMNYIRLKRIADPADPNNPEKDILSAEKVAQLRRLSFATYLLVANDRSFFHLNAIYTDEEILPRKVRGAQYFPEYDVDLGSPAQSYFTGSDTSGLLTRYYEKGFVILNPDYWEDNSAPASSSIVLPVVPDCSASQNCYYEEIVLSGGGYLWDSPGIISAGRTYHAGDTVSLPRTDAIILKFVKN